MRYRMAGVLILTAVLGGAAAANDYPFGARVTGTGKPVILVPGLGCDGAVWDTTVAHFKDKCECHVLTPAGFASSRR
jgi:N-formylmaleamate deformylase